MNVTAGGMAVTVCVATERVLCDLNVSRALEIEGKRVQLKMYHHSLRADSLGCIGGLSWQLGRVSDVLRRYYRLAGCRRDRNVNRGGCLNFNDGRKDYVEGLESNLILRSEQRYLSLRKWS